MSTLSNPVIFDANIVWYKATPFAKEGREIMELVRKKSTDEDIEPVITSIEQQASSLGVEDPMLPSTDAFVTSICFVGS